MTDKQIKEGEGKGFSFCMAEMQGKLVTSQVGERVWRMPQSTRSSWEMATRSSPSSMDMEVKIVLYRPLGQQICGGQVHRSAHQSRILQTRKL